MAGRRRYVIIAPADAARGTGTGLGHRRVTPGYSRRVVRAYGQHRAVRGYRHRPVGRHRLGTAAARLGAAGAAATRFGTAAARFGTAAARLDAAGVPLGRTSAVPLGPGRSWRRALRHRGRHRRPVRPAVSALRYGSVSTLVAALVASGWFAGSGAAAVAQMIHP